MKRIPLTQGKFALVEDADYEWLNQWKWHFRQEKREGYAIRKQYLYTKNGKEYYENIRMHRLITETPEDMFCDHEDGNGLNNQRYNLRNCTKADNQRNRGPQKNNTSGYKNIFWHSQDNMWRVRVAAKGQKVQGSLHHKIEDAIVERNRLVKEMHGSFARTEAFSV